MKKLFLVLTVFTLLISCSSDDSSDTPPANNNVVQETFGNWSPDFTNQTANFTQTRTGTQGTQQTRTIVVTITSSTASSTEEILGEDINEDEDLFDEVEITTSNYSASEALGSYTTISYTVLEDNNMVFKVGNQSFEISNGFFATWGLANEDNNDCITYNGYGNEFQLWGPDASLNSDGNIVGEGLEIYFDLYTSNSNELDKGIYNFIWDDAFWQYETQLCIQKHEYEVLTSDYGDYQLKRENSDSGEDYIQIKSGELSINIIGDKYVIKFIGLDEINNSISFYFNGVLTKPYNYSDKSSGEKRKRVNN